MWLLTIRSYGLEGPQFAFEIACLGLNQVIYMFTKNVKEEMIILEFKKSLNNWLLFSYWLKDSSKKSGYSLNSIKKAKATEEKCNLSQKLFLELSHLQWVIDWHTNGETSHFYFLPV